MRGCNYLGMLFVFLLLALLLPVAEARQLLADPSSYRAVLSAMTPGDTLQLSAGEYRRGLPLHRLQGLSAEPITISGPASGPRAVFIAQPGHNTISILNSSYITIRNLELDGRNLPVDGVKAEGHADWAHHITLENLLIRNHGHHQQTVAISTKCPAWGWQVRGNVIIGAGTGLYFGNSDGSDPFVASVIENNLIVDTIGYNLQIKHQLTRAGITGMPQGEQQTIIRHNVFSKANGGSSGGQARPNVLVGHWPLSGAGQDDRYLIYGNFFYQNPNESLFQGEGNLALYNNLFVNEGGDAIRIQPHNDILRHIAVFFNTVVSAKTGIVLRQSRGALVEQASTYPQWLTANVVFAAQPIEAKQLSGNVVGTPAQATAYLRRPQAPPGEMDLRPKEALTAPFDPAQLTQYHDWNLDFNGNLRKAGIIGAYAGEFEENDWVPRIELKPPWLH